MITNSVFTRTKNVSTMCRAEKLESCACREDASTKSLVDEFRLRVVSALCKSSETSPVNYNDLALLVDSSEEIQTMNGLLQSMVISNEIVLRQGVLNGVPNWEFWTVTNKTVTGISAHEAVVEGPSIGSSGDCSIVQINLEKLLDSKLLVTAASGGGKSWAIRRILEQTYQLVQHLVIDPEGEFDTLTEKFPYLVCRVDSGDIRLSITTAGALAQELMKTRVSTILDISGFDMEERTDFVAEFIKGLMSLPQEHWHHAMVVIDEAQIFAPQHDKSTAKKPVIDLASRGRKRGLGVLLATQRLSKLNKSAAAELHNRMIGLSVLDVDIKRSAEELGMSASEAEESIANLMPGEFYVYGPALTRRVTKVKVGSVETKHGVLSGIIDPPVPSSSETIRAISERIKIANTPESHGLMRVLHSTPFNAAKLVEIAKQRLNCIIPVLSATRGGRTKAVAAAAEQAQVSQATIYQWLKRYDANDELGSLVPSRASVLKQRGIAVIAAVA